MGKAQSGDLKSKIERLFFPTTLQRFRELYICDLIQIAKWQVSYGERQLVFSERIPLVNDPLLHGFMLEVSVDYLMRNGSSHAYIHLIKPGNEKRGFLGSLAARAYWKKYPSQSAEEHKQTPVDYFLKWSAISKKIVMASLERILRDAIFKTSVFGRFGIHKVRPSLVLNVIEWFSPDISRTIAERALIDLANALDAGKVSKSWIGEREKSLIDEWCEHGRAEWKDKELAEKIKILFPRYSELRDPPYYRHCVKFGDC